MEVKKKVRPDGTFDLHFKSKGGRVSPNHHMSLPLVLLLLPVSCVVTSPLPLLTYDRAAARDAFPASSAILWLVVAAALAFGVLRAYNFRRVTLERKLHVHPAYVDLRSAPGNFGALHVYKYSDFVARPNPEARHSPSNYGVFAWFDGEGFVPVVHEVSKETAQAIAQELRNAMKKDA